MLSGNIFIIGLRHPFTMVQAKTLSLKKVNYHANIFQRTASVFETIHVTLGKVGDAKRDCASDFITAKYRC